MDIPSVQLGHGESTTPKFYPVGGHEVPIAILLETDNKPVLIESSSTDSKPDYKVLLRLGTRANDRNPSNVGFRAMLRTNSPNQQPLESMEESYHVISYAFNPKSNEIGHGPTSAQNLKILEELFPSVAAMAPLYEMHFKMLTGFTSSSFGGAPNVTDSAISKILQDLHLVKGPSTRLALYFPYDSQLVTYLEKAIAAGCKGERGVVWSDSLPASVEPDWPFNIQDRMVEGSTGPINALRSILREPLLSDSLSTKVTERKLATIFNSYTREVFPRLPTHYAQPCLPIFLDVKGICTELPLGGSMVNKHNIETTLVLVRRLIDYGLPSASIGIITFYPSQAANYSDRLTAYHAEAPKRGYESIHVDVLENWVDKEVDIAIVDLVRTPNASGNLGLLSQQRRLKVALTRHKNGLVLIGDRGCTKNARGEITSLKLEKVLGWFDDNRRVVSANLLKHMSQHGQRRVVPSVENPEFDPIALVGGRDLRDPSVQPISNSRTSELPAMTFGDSSVSLDRARRYVGIPELERDLKNLQLAKETTQSSRPSALSNTSTEIDKAKNPKLPEPEAALSETLRGSPWTSSQSLLSPHMQQTLSTNQDVPSRGSAEKPPPPTIRFEWPSRQEQPKMQNVFKGQNANIKQDKESPSAPTSSQRGRTMNSDVNFSTEEPIARLQSPLRAINKNSQKSSLTNMSASKASNLPLKQEQARSKREAPTTWRTESNPAPDGPKRASTANSLLGEGLYTQVTAPVPRVTATPKKENIPAKSSVNPFATSTFKPDVHSTTPFAKPLEQLSEQRKRIRSPPKPSVLSPSPPINSEFGEKNGQRKSNIESIVKTLRGNKQLSSAPEWQKVEYGLVDLKYAFEREDSRGFDDAHAKLCKVLGGIMGIAGK